MLSYAVYKIVHILGIALALVSLGGFAVHALHGGAKSDNRARTLLIAMHGAGAFLVLLGGFGLLARINFPHGEPFPGWLWVKLLVWLAVAAIVMLPYRKPNAARPMLLALPLLAVTAALMAVYKPF
jgi:uncharacterized membrane protein SirB2